MPPPTLGLLGPYSVTGFAPGFWTGMETGSGQSWFLLGDSVRTQHASPSLFSIVCGMCLHVQQPNFQGSPTPVSSSGGVTDCLPDDLMSQGPGVLILWRPPLVVHKSPSRHSAWETTWCGVWVWGSLTPTLGDMHFEGHIPFRK